MTFLSIITRTYKRPVALAACLASQEEQTCRDFEHDLIVDEVGVGIEETYRLMSVRDWHEITGEYVYFLDDDNVLTGPDVVQSIRDVTKNRPDIIVARAILGNLGLLPPHLGIPLMRGRIDLGCVVMRRDIFLQAARCFQPRYDGDFDYIAGGIAVSNSLVWLNKIIMRAQRRSFGEPEL